MGPSLRSGPRALCICGFKSWLCLHGLCWDKPPNGAVSVFTSAQWERHSLPPRDRGLAFAQPSLGWRPAELAHLSDTPFRLT